MWFVITSPYPLKIGGWTKKGFDSFSISSTLNHMPMFNISPPSWMEDALCQEVGVEVFFPPDDKPVSRDFYRQAKRICDNCPVKKQCLDFGISDQYGVWGGTTPQERVKIREVRRKSR